MRDNHFDADVWTKSVAGVIKTILRPSQSWVSIEEVMRRMGLPISHQNKATKNRVAGILRQMNYTQVRIGSDGSRARVWLPPPKISEKPQGKVTSTTIRTPTTPNAIGRDVDAPKPAPDKAAFTTSTTSTSFHNIRGKDERQDVGVPLDTAVPINRMLQKNVDVADGAEEVGGARVSERPQLQKDVDDVDVDGEKPSTPKGINRGHSFPAAPLPFVPQQPRKSCNQCGYYDEPIEHHGWCHLMCGEIEGHHVECTQWVAVTS